MSNPNTELWRHYQAQITALEQLQLNFDLERRHEYTKENGWNIDEYEADLPAEPPGEPIEGGAFRAAQAIVRNYEFPDPKIITGIFPPDRPLEQRVMLLKARFLTFTFYFGVRIGDVIDTTRDGPKGKERVWGYNYRTLEGHFERGQLDVQVIKYLETGAVVFRMFAFSQTAEIANPFYRVGFALFGRPLQRTFARRSLERMQRLVAERLSPTVAIPEPKPEVTPISASPKAEEALHEIEEQAEAAGQR